MRNPRAVPFDKDRTHAQYDPVYVQKFWHALVQINRVMNVFRARFLGKASPVHFFWGSFDLVVTRFSGRTAPPPKGHTPHVADWIMAEAYSRECSSCGFWPGNGGFGYPAFYVYAYPEPVGYGDTRLKTAGASYNNDLGQFILPYDAVRQARDPDALLGFLQETYAAAADLAKWDRNALEAFQLCPRAGRRSNQPICSSCRTIAAPSASAFILPKATARGRYSMPQSGATTSRSAGTCLSAARMRPATICGVSIVISDRSITPRMMVFDGNSLSTLRSSFGCAASTEICCALQPSNSGRNE